MHEEFTPVPQALIVGSRRGTLAQLMSRYHKDIVSVDGAAQPGDIRSWKHYKVVLVNIDNGTYKNLKDNPPESISAQTIFVGTGLMRVNIERLMTSLFPEERIIYTTFDELEDVFESMM